MEQTNLVVTPDGKTWDEVTRDVSYIGNLMVSTTTDTETTSTSSNAIFDEWRGGTYEYQNKNFAIAYDRLICLVDGQYEFSITNYNNGNVHCSIYINAVLFLQSLSNNYDQTNDYNNLSFSGSHYLKRGDYVQIRGAFGGDTPPYMRYQIQKI